MSQEYEPLDFARLPYHVQELLRSESNLSEIPHLTEFQVWEKMKAARVVKSRVHGDLPSKLAKEFSPELALPFSIIFNQILKTGKWPSSWKLENGIPLAKISEPLSESDLRIVSITNWPSKILEQFVVGWLMEHIGDKIDQKQFRAMKKVSMTHYLIEFVSFILYNWDFKEN